MPSIEPAQHARDAAESVRQFNHSTLPSSARRPGLTYPSEAYDAIAALKILVQRLPQAIEQIGVALDALGELGHLGSTDGEDPARHVAITQGFLSTAMECAGGIAQSLDLAHSAVSPLAYSGPDVESEQQPRDGAPDQY